MALGEAVNAEWGIACAQGTGVEGEAGEHVQVAKQGLAERDSVPTRLLLLNFGRRGLHFRIGVSVKFVCFATGDQQGKKTTSNLVA